MRNETIAASQGGLFYPTRVKPQEPATIGVWLSRECAKRVTTGQLLRLKEKLKELPGFKENPLIINANEENGRMFILQQIPYRTSQGIQQAVRTLENLLKEFLELTFEFIRQRLLPKEIEAFCRA